MRLSPTLWLLAIPLLGSCQFLPHHDFFKAPQNEPNPAWVRIVNYTQHSELFQYENGVRSGGLIRRNEFVLVHTQDKGMPKAGQDLTFNYYETPVRPGLETDVDMTYIGDRTDSCTVSARFTPKAEHYYQFLMESGYGVGKCTMYPTLIERDKTGPGWHLSPNPDVTYAKGSNESKTSYFMELYKDPSYKGFNPGP
ncbi:hypothetical protein [Pseudomonas asplenii]|uniref:hypothetical protein n=1 Tax=Pseudomonas asplenii TaxID=53407 RepID=UPI0023606A2F|nr:hypothetical protein [Pseudomonas asplenii]